MILFLFKRRKQVKIFSPQPEELLNHLIRNRLYDMDFSESRSYRSSKTKKFICRVDMKKFVFTFIVVLAFVGFAAATVSAESPVKPVIEGEMPDCYMPIGSDGITLFTNVGVTDGGTLV